MKIPEILNTIDLNEEQIKALDEFFKGWTEDIKSSMQKQFIGKSRVPQGYIKQADAEKAFELYTKDAEKAFELYTKDAEKAFELYKEDSEKAFELAKKDWTEEFNTILEQKQNQWTESFAKAMQDVYEEVEVRVQKDFQSSDEYKAFQKVKEPIIPVTITESQKEILEKIKSYEEREEILEKNEKELSKEKAINTLLQDFPAEYSEMVRKFVSKAVTEEEVYERFNTIVEMVDKGIINKNGKATVVNENIEPKTKAVFKRKIEQSKLAAATPKRTTAKPVFESVTNKEKPVAPTKKTKQVTWDEAVIGLAFPKQMI